MNSSTNASLLTAAQLAALVTLERRRALDSLPAFVTYMRNAGCDSRYFANDPHPAQRPLIEAAEALVKGDDRAITVSCPPSFSKSTVFSIWLPCWALARNPRLRVLWSSHTDGVVQLFARERRNIFNHPAWQALAETAPVDAQAAPDTFAFAAGGSIISRSASASVTGLRGDLLLADDLVSGSDEARSRPMLASLWTWVEQDWLTRRDNNDSKFAFIGTRWSVLDPIGQLQRLTDSGVLTCRHVRIPMIADSPDDPLGRTFGEWIDWPGRFDDAEQRVLCQRNPFAWSTLYQQRPYDSAGGFCTPGSIAIRAIAPQGRVGMGVDFAMTDSSRADYTAVAVGIAHLNEQGEPALCITGFWRGQRSARVVAEQVVDQVRIHAPTIFAVENDSSSKVYLDSSLPGEFVRRSVSPPHVVRLPSSGASKEVKNSPLRSLIEKGLVSFVAASWNDQLLDELVNFPSGDHDDGVDALGCLARVFDKYLARGLRPEPKQDENQLVHAPRSSRECGVVTRDGQAHFILGELDGLRAPRERLP